jgi:glycosyltransferase involved in cell wall biosynthesis
MCTYNGAPFVRAQLESILAQSRPPDEIVICDDGSTDETISVIKDFAGVPIILYSNEKNRGTVKNFESAIGLCTGDIIALSDQDDVWREDKLQKTEEAFRKTPTAGLVFSDAEIVDENLTPLNRRMWNEVDFNAQKRKLVGQGRALDVLITGWTVTGAAMAFRSAYKKLALPIPTNIPMIHDGWIALSIAAVSSVVAIDEPLIKYRQHAGQQIGAPKRKANAQPTSTLDALKRRSSSTELQHTLDVLRERLSAHTKEFDCRNALAFVNNYSHHLDARANLPARRLNRVPTILRELLTWRYHDYANGFKSAAKDLVS